MTTRVRLGFCSLFMIATLSGCALLPAERQYARVPTVPEYIAPEYRQAYVYRGELALTEKVTCRYAAVRESALSFGVNDVYYDALYVSRGDFVQEGDLLAVLEMGDLPRQIADAANRMRELLLEREQVREKQALAVRHQQALLRLLNNEDRRRAATAEEIRADYDDWLKGIEDAIYLHQLWMEELELSRGKREIRADMSGTVTYLYGFKPGERSTANMTVLKIKDLTRSVFIAATEYYNLFTPGDIVTLNLNRTEYEAAVTSPEELNLPAEIKNDTVKRYVYFSLTEPDPELKDGAMGSLTITLDYRADTLYLTKSAVYKVDDTYLVYYKDPGTGIRGMKYITIGLKTPNYYEVLEGLSAGDAVILR